MDQRRIIFFLYEGFLQLDLAGPNAAFSFANEQSEKEVYRMIYTSPSGGLISTFGGPDVMTVPVDTVAPRATDTIMVAGGEIDALLRVSNEQSWQDWIRASADHVERISSVCTGSAILAAAGLLDGRKVTTHWAACREMQRKFPLCHVVADSLYVNDGKLWTSAGVTTGIDMTLEMIKQDHGSHVMSAVAKGLVVYAKRPGNQSQFSTLLSAQVSGSNSFFDVVTWIEANLDKAIKVQDLADRACMSERTFYRQFSHRMGQTPTQFLESIRFEKATHLLEANAAIKTVAAAIGFRSEAGFRAAFQARYDMTPSLYRSLHSPAHQIN